MEKRTEKKLRVVQFIQLAVFFIAVVFVILAPSAERVNSSGNLSARAIYLAQIRQFFCIPLCFSCGAGVIVSSVFGKKYSPPKKVRAACFICGLVLIGLGVYYCYGFAAFQFYPPLTFETGMYLMRNSWMISIWWSIAMVLLTISVFPDAVNAGSKPRRP